MKARSALSLVLVASLTCCATIGMKPKAPQLDPNPPKTLDEALDRLERTLPPETIQQMRDGTEQELAEYHFGVGLWIRNYWGLWGQGPLYRHLADLGLRHPDDMSAVVLTSLWRRLHGQPLRIQEEVAHYQEYWRLAQDPDPSSNPECSSMIETTLSIGGVHMGTCCADGRVWSYHVDRGWYAPTAEELAVWSEGHGYDPCKK